MSFSMNHAAMLCKYAGISFIAGAVTHGVFSEQRSLLTALIGIVLYLLACYLEALAAPDTPRNWTHIIAFGVLASIGLGFFTGGLQHFPDSPERSLWVVPLGFVMSLLATHWMDASSSVMPSKDRIGYGLAGLIVVGALSVGAAQYFGGRTHDANDGHHGKPAVPLSAPAPAPAASQPVAPHQHKGKHSDNHKH